MIRLLILLLTWLLPQLAFAQASPTSNSFGQLTLTPPPDDLAIVYLGDMFGAVKGVLPATGSQLLGSLFSVFNSAVLVLGGIVIMYIVFVSLLATAHEGEALGKRWSSIWIPLRAVMGIALLVPTAGGYSFIQIFMMWVITMGVGAADSLWNTALNSFLGGTTIIQPSQSPGNINGGSMIDKSATLLRSLTCMAMVQTQFQSYHDVGGSVQAPPDFLQGVLNKFSTIGNSGTIKFPESGYYQTDGVCGSVTWTPVSLPSFMMHNGSVKPEYAYLQTRITSSRTTAVEQMINYLYPPAIKLTINATATNPQPLGQIISRNNPWVWGAGSLSNPIPPLLNGSLLSDTAAFYYAAMANALNLKNGMKNDQSWLDEAKAGGWLLAGRYYYDMVDLNNQVNNLGGDSEPTFSGPPTQLSQNTKITNVLPASPYAINIDNLVNGKGASQIGVSSKFMQDAPTYGRYLSYGQQSSIGSVGEFFSGDMPPGVDDVLSIFTAGLSNIVSGFVGLATTEQTNANPILSIAQLGSGLVTLSFLTFITAAGVLFSLAIGLGAAWGFALAVAAQVITTVIMTLLGPILIVLIVAGLMMAFYIPLVPFIIFLFGAIGWFIAVVEAMMAAPLVALGIAHPEGQEVLGKAEPAVMLLVNVFLRPTFMIFGLLIGMQLSYIGVWLANRGFWSAFINYAIQGIRPAPVMWLFFPAAILIIYTIIVQQILQKSFSLIHIIPDEVLKWIGGNIKGLGGEAQVEQTIQGQVHGGMQKQGEMVGAAPKDAKAFEKISAKNKSMQDEATKNRTDMGLEGQNSPAPAGGNPALNVGAGPAGPGIGGGGGGGGPAIQMPAGGGAPGGGGGPPAPGGLPGPGGG